MKGYWLSMPERLVRAVLGLGAGAAREVSEVALPDGIRNTQLYHNLVETTLRFLIEDVGGAEGAYPAAAGASQGFLARRAAGSAVETLGIVAFRASPVWVLAALADVCGAGRQLIPEIADALKAQGLLEQDAQFGSVDELLDGLQRTSSHVAATINAPPLDVAGLRAEWESIRNEARTLQPDRLPGVDAVRGMWTGLKEESARQQQSIFATSSMMALSAARAIPNRLRWLTLSAGVGAARTGEVVAGALLDHYKTTLNEMRDAGYAAYASRQLGPYLRAAATRFSPDQRTITQSLIDKLR
jgi:hypothetical protein